MKLKKLLKEIPVKEVKGSKEIEITGLCSNSKLVAPGHLFIAKKGLTHDGSRFIGEAIAAGAVCVLTDIYDPFLAKEVTQIIDPNVNAIEGLLAAEYYQHPSSHLFVVGITGTNGKTTTSYLIKHLLDAMKESCGLIGTIEWIVGKHYFPATYTTPDVISNHKLLHDMVESDCKSAVMEVSSHAIHQGRTYSIDFDVAVFTNLTQDHLDYHGTMQDYAEAKAQLFSFLGKNSSAKKSYPKVAVINADSPWAPAMIKECKVPVLTYGMELSADIRAIDLHLHAKGLEFTLEYKKQSVRFSCGLIGKFNVYNCLAAFAVGISRGFALNKMAEVLSHFKQVPGRLERVPNEKGLHIFVDYAHTDDALKNVLETLGELKKAKLICLFGCGGNRDAGKRPKMGAVAEALSDEIVITSDNPRNEDPIAIIQEILLGIKNPARALVEPDRKTAIEKAIHKMKQNDILLIAGKGHETYQILSNQKIDFDDRLVAQTCCK